jgi:hypothetical protein
MTLARLLAVTFVLTLCNSAAGQTNHVFEITFDGTDPAVDAGSVDPAGINLLPGDSFEVNLHASPGNFWRVESPYTQSFPMSFIVSPSAIRTADIEALFMLDGVQMESIVNSNQSQQEVHIGAERWTLPVGLEFDTVLLNYALLSVEAVPDESEMDPFEDPEFMVEPLNLAIDTTIVDRPEIFGSISNPERPFFRNSNISFNAIPEPATFALGMAGVLTLSIFRRRKLTIS